MKVISIDIAQFWLEQIQHQNEVIKIWAKNDPYIMRELDLQAAYIARKLERLEVVGTEIYPDEKEIA